VSGGGNQPDSDITAEFTALQKLAGAGPGATAGSGLPSVLSALTSLQKACGTQLQTPQNVVFPDADAFGAYYSAVLDQLVGPQSATGMQVLVTHVTALSEVAQWTTTNYQTASELENAGANTIKDKLDQTLTASATAQSPGASGLPAGAYPTQTGANPGGAQ
jgi:hypothetical protein